MHFTKFMTVSQINNNSQMISAHLNKPYSANKDQTIESDSPRVRKKLSNHFSTNSAFLNLQSQSVQQNQTFQLFSSRFSDNSGITNHKSSKAKGFPLDPQQERLSYTKYNHHGLSKLSQNNIIQENEEAQKQEDDLKPKYLPIKGSQAESKYIFKNRKASCNLQQLAFLKSPNRKNSYQSSLLDQQKRQKVLIKKKSQGWDQNNNFQFGSSNPASQGKSNQESHQNLLPELHKYKNLRKQSQHVQTPKKQVPSFLSSSKHHRNSVDLVELNQRKKMTIQDFIIIKQLGKGTFGRVVLAAQKQSRIICAIKIMSKRDIRENNMVEQLIRQLKIQMLISHPNIVKIYSFFDDLLHLYILIQCALDGHLSEYIKKSPNPIPEIEAGIMMKQICSAVSLLHSQSIIHRDLKPQNVLLHEGVVKICDFGWSVKRDCKLRTTFCGTPVYLCPEILVGDEYDQCVDIWTIGIILYQMIYKTNPFHIATKQDLINILNNPIDFKQNIQISKMVKDFIEVCLAKRACERPNIRELLLHQFILNAQSAEQQKQ